MTRGDGPAQAPVGLRSDDLEVRLVGERLAAAGERPSQDRDPADPLAGERGTDDQVLAAVARHVGDGQGCPRQLHVPGEKAPPR